MKPRHFYDLLLLAALWGASFLFMRVSAPEFGAIGLAAARALGAALMLLPLALARGQWAALRAKAVPIMVTGIIASALPFVLYSYAALSLPAGLSAVFNAATPLFGAAIAWVWLGDGLSSTRTLGLGIGFLGVLGLAWSRIAPSGVAASSLEPSTLAVLACLASTLLYGVGASMTKRYLQGVNALAVAAGSQVGAALVLAPWALFYLPAASPSPAAWASALGLAILCTAVAYVLFFKLIGEIGPGRAMTVTYLIPAFAMVWGALFLGEVISGQMLLGCAVILLGTALATGLVSRPSQGG